MPSKSLGKGDKPASPPGMRPGLAPSQIAASSSLPLDASSDPRLRRFGGWLAPEWLGLSLVAAALFCTYANSLRGEFVFDDLVDVAGNPSLGHLNPLQNVVVADPKRGWALRHRPVTNYSFALNHAFCKLDPFGYHLTNVCVHVLAGFALFGIVRRTLLLPGLLGRFGAAALPIALVSATLWGLHPLDTQAVSYITQRYESLMGLFYLTAVYAVIRSATSRRPITWGVAAVVAAALALGAKEVAVSLPVVILLYDRAFLAGSFREAWRQRWMMYLGLLADWGLFAAVQSCAASRAHWAGYGLPMTGFEYLCSQPGVILHYLRLAFWPRPLVLDYAWPVARSPAEILPGLAVIGGIAVATLFALARRPKWGTLGAAFFLILAPTSSVMPLNDLAVEHRMYLPLTTVVTALVVGGYVALGQLSRRSGIFRPTRASRALGGGLLACVALVLAVMTWTRNSDYTSRLILWEDTVAKAPRNARAHNNLGRALGEIGRADEAEQCYRAALALDPHLLVAHVNLGLALRARGQIDDAIGHFQTALMIDPFHVPARLDLANTLEGQGKHEEAIVHYRQVIESEPASAVTHFNLACNLAAAGNLEDAIVHYRKALEIMPDYAEAHNNLGNALVQEGRNDEAIIHFQRFLEIQPNNAAVRRNLGIAWERQGKMDEAVAQYQQAVELLPAFAEGYNSLGMALDGQGKTADAIIHYEKALRIMPAYEDARKNLARALNRKDENADMLTQPNKARDK